MLSFYTRGMSFVDIAYLKKADLKSGVLTYRRQKTGRRLSIKWEKPVPVSYTHLDVYKRQPIRIWHPSPSPSIL